MMKICLILLLSIGTIYSQEINSDLIVGTWRLYQKCDLRSLAEKNKIVEIPWCPIETENGTNYPDRTFKEDGTYSDYYSVDNIEYGKWEIKKKSIILTQKIPDKKVESKTKFIDKLLSSGIITRGKDGFYYQKTSVLLIKTISENRVEFGNDDVYSIYDRVKKVGNKTYK